MTLQAVIEILRYLNATRPHDLVSSGALAYCAQRNTGTARTVSILLVENTFGAFSIRHVVDNIQNLISCTR